YPVQAAGNAAQTAFILPRNGGNRKRLSRQLAGGFLFYLPLRCTNPQLSGDVQKILVPFFAFVCVCCEYKHSSALGFCQHTSGERVRSSWGGHHAHHATHSAKK